ncbi:TPA: putative Ig domain-containing protein [Photobacterium damselae]
MFNIIGAILGETRTPIQVKIQASDQYNSPIVYTIKNSPQWIHLNPDTGVLSGIPGRDDSGNFTVIITASNGKQQATSNKQLQWSKYK